MRTRLLALLPAAVLLPLLTAAPVQAAGPTGDPSAWSDRHLAAQLVLAGYDMSRTDDALPWVREGLGGVVLFGTPPSDLAARLQRLRAAGTVVPIVSSDEEGGRVQRLRSVLGALPSAEEMGRTRTAAQVRALAASYGTKMARLGVDVDLAPVTDLGVRGFYVEQTDRAFSADPAKVGAYAGAWQAGLRSARVAPVAKHWPGHGQATNTHDAPATTPPLSTLEQRDLLPFRDLLAAGVPAVMVGHLNVPGLTEQGTPATLSPNAYRYLREKAGAARLLMTDSLSMGAISRGLGLTPAQAAVRALSAGADVVLVDPGPGPGAVVDAVSRAIADGRYARSAAVASVRRVLNVKRTTNAPLPMTSLAPAAGTTGASLTPTLGGVVRDRIGGPLVAQFYLRTAGSATWNVANGGRVSAPAGSRASYRVTGVLRPATAYEWSARACNAAGLCAPAGPVLRFTTRAA